jgi:uncharacterized protein (TIGR00297 family)
MQLAAGFLLALIIGGLAWRAGALSPSGALAATLTGGLTFGLGGLPWAVLLLAFFISSSGLSRLFAGRKAVLSEKFAKGSRRDWAQVLANGGLGAALAIAWALLGGPDWAWLGFAGAMAAVNADTWATELGVLSPAPPRLVTNGKAVERGASGGISPLGSLAALGGALLVAGLAAAIPPAGYRAAAGSSLLGTLAAVTLGGGCGAFFDSILGATVQAIYYCPNCEKETERHPRHTCGIQTTRIRGWEWLNNDVVNFLASMVGGAVTVILWRLFI